MAPAPAQPAKLEDIISYVPETYFSDDELATIRAHFGGPEGAKLLRLVKKALLPSVFDPELPTENIAQDAFMGLVDFKNVPSEEAKALAMGLQYIVKGIAGSLINLKHIANVKADSPADIAARMEKDSTK